MSRPSPVRRLAAVVTALAATFALSSTSAVAVDSPDSALTAKSHTFKDRDADSLGVKKQNNVQRMQVTPKFKRGKIVKVRLQGRTLAKGNRLNVGDVLIKSKDNTEFFRVFWLLPDDGDNIQGMRMFDRTLKGDSIFGKQIKCKGMSGKFISGKRMKTVEIRVPRHCLGNPKKINVNGGLWHVIKYNKRNGFPKRGFPDFVYDWEREKYSKAI